jgi:hypothetical protein
MRSARSDTRHWNRTQASFGISTATESLPQSEGDPNTILMMAAMSIVRDGDEYFSRHVTQKSLFTYVNARIGT